MNIPAIVKAASNNGCLLSNEELNFLPAARLNRDCFCTSLDSSALKIALSSEPGMDGLHELIEERCPYLFSARPIFVSYRQSKRIADVIAAIESVISLPSYRARVLTDAPDIAKHNPDDAKGVFFGYDFHIHDDTLALIEINTNAGGAMLNAAMAKAHRSCCLSDSELTRAIDSGATLEDTIFNMFESEWALSQRSQPLRTVAIVDEHPEQQYLYPEFVLFQRLFERHGIEAVIASPSDLTYRDGVLRHGDLAIDLVYNRLTDFMLESPQCLPLRSAYLDSAIVLTPHPQAHALYANKANLVLLSDKKELVALGVAPAVQDILLKSIPRTQIVTASDADRLWTERRKLFFKPVAGYGGRATYRGEKITKRVWQDILAGDYVAQALVIPGERSIGSTDNPSSLKFDLRVYVYDGKVQWTAARMYQGQTTNFRTPGGGFAPVYSLDDERTANEISSIATRASSHHD